MDQRLIQVHVFEDIPEDIQSTPSGQLLAYHNLGLELPAFEQAQMLIGTCIDFRVSIKIPDRFAYVIRTAGANLRFSEFQVSFAIAVGGISSIAVIGHDQCGMANLEELEEQFVTGLVNHTAWSEKTARDHFMHYAPLHHVEHEVDFVLKECRRLRLGYPNIHITPMLFELESQKLLLIKE